MNVRANLKSCLVMDMFLIAIVGSAAVGQIIYVDADANGANDGSSWANACNYLQDALVDANSGDEIRVAQGIYKPDQGGGITPGDRTATFQLINGVTLRGAYAGFGQPDPNARDVREYETILSGDLNGDDGPNFANNDENSHRVVTGSRTDAPTVLDGFTVTAGNGVSGAGIYNLYQSNLTLTNCLISGNFARYGGGICIQGGDNIALTNCIISSNATKGYNHNGRGGGICVLNEVNVTMTNCTITGNSAEEAKYGNGRGGGGICSWGGATITLINCILWGNSDLGGIDESAQIYLSYRKEPHGAEAIINYCCIQGWTGNLGGTGNIGDEPLFVDSTGGNYHLSELSPCINAGDPNYPYDPNEMDLDGRPRVIGGRIDMGAYEYSPPVPAEVRIVPRNINLASKGKWIACYIWLGEEYDVAAIDPNSVVLEGEIEALSLVVDEDQQVAMARFSRSEVQGILAPGEVELTVSGELSDGTRFEGADIIRVIDKGKKK